MYIYAAIDTAHYSELHDDLYVVYTVASIMPQCCGFYIYVYTHKWFEAHVCRVPMQSAMLQ